MSSSYIMFHTADFRSFSCHSVCIFVFLVAHFIACLSLSFCHLLRFHGQFGPVNLHNTELKAQIICTLASIYTTATLALNSLQETEDITLYVPLLIRRWIPHLSFIPSLYPVRIRTYPSVKYSSHLLCPKDSYSFVIIFSFIQNQR